jgi:hypothetical protein
MLDAGQANDELPVVVHQMSEPPRSRSYLSHSTTMLFKELHRVVAKVNNPSIDSDKR